MMVKKVSFYSRSSLSPSGLDLGENYTLLHGEHLDDRGVLAVSLGSSGVDRALVHYDNEEMMLTLNGVSVSADLCVDLFRSLPSDKPVVLEATTLGFSELFLSIRALIDLGANRIEIIYVEPLDYTKRKGGDQYALSELIKGYKPIPNSIVDLTSDDLEAGVFFLGFESERLDRALEEHQMIANKNIKVVFGIPAFQPGWELNSIVPHLTRLGERGGGVEIAYCAANDPEAAYESLEAARDTLGEGKSMFVAPIGTKPCGIASAVFASLYPGQAGLLFDHPKKKDKRSEGSGLWHRYTVVLNSDN